MDSTPHIFLAGPGANSFAREKGVPFASDDELITDFAREALDDFIHGRGEATSELGLFFYLFKNSPLKSVHK
jgi:isoaspartyl peptidase/L-asparaginase-like protein (Ntn-hydrolase superfamily)